MTDQDAKIEQFDLIRKALESLEASTLTSSLVREVHQALASLDELKSRMTASDDQGRLVALYRVSRVLGTSLEIDQVLNQVMDAFVELSGAERGFLILSESENTELVVRAARNIDQQNLSDPATEVSLTVVRSVLATGEAVITTNAQSDPRFSEQSSVISLGLRSVLCAPLRSRDQIIGVVYVDNRAHSGIFSKDDLSLLNAFANQAAIAIENARNYTQTGRSLAERVQELEQLSVIDVELNDQLVLDHVMEITCIWAVQGIQAESCGIALQQSAEKNLVLVQATGTHISLDGDDPIALKAVESGEIVRLLPEANDGHYRYYIPVSARERSLGVLFVESLEALPQSEQQFLVRLVARSASAIENARLYEAVQNANQAKSKFVSVVSHELRLPMTSIKGYADLLVQGVADPVNEDQVNFLDVIRNNVERMRVLVSDLSDISRIETEKLQLSPEATQLGAHIEQIVESLKPHLDERQQSVQVLMAQDLPAVWADPNRLMQVLTNLLSNAWKYSPPESEIQVSASQVDDRIVVEVADKGYGINEADRAMLFTQFFRSDDMKVREQQGWGLGLYVTRQLVELMGGEMGMESEFERGSRFWFSLPVGSADPVEA